MPYIKVKTDTGWKTATKAWVKTTLSPQWRQPKRIWMKLLSGWTTIWPVSGPFAEDYPYITTTSSGSTRYGTEASGTGSIPRRIGDTIYGRNVAWNANGWTISSYTYEWRIYDNKESDDFTGQATLLSGTYSAPSESLILSSGFDKKFLSFYIKANTSSSLNFGEVESGENPYIGRTQIIKNQPAIFTGPDIVNGTGDSYSINGPRVDETLFFEITWDTASDKEVEYSRTITKWYKKLTAPTYVISGDRVAGGYYLDTTGATLLTTGTYYKPTSADLDYYIFCNQEVFNSGTDYDFGGKVEGFGMKTGYFSNKKVTNGEYTITWSVQSPATVSPTSTTASIGTVITPPVPVKTGYDFIAWRDGTTLFNSAYILRLSNSDTWTIGQDNTTDITFYAEWVAKKIKVTYEEHGGTTVTDVTVNYGDAVTLPSITRTNYTFNGWYSAATGGTRYGDNPTTFIPTEDITLHAQWTAISSTVTWDAKGGSVSPSSTSGNAGDSITVPTPTRTGYTLTWWRNPETGGDPVTLQPGTSYTLPQGNITFYAIWSGNTYYISYRGNGHTGGAVPSDGSYTVGGSAYGIMNQGTLVKDNYTFTGWNTASNGTGTSYAANASYSTAADLILYAQWTAKNYTVTWNPNTGTVSPTSSSGTYGTNVTAPTPTRAGYDFLYWRDGTTAFNYANQINAGSTWTITGDTTFYANWAQQTYTVTYDEQGGTAVNDASVAVGSSTTLPSISKTGSTFNGWYTAASGGTRIGEYPTTYTPTGNVTLYAQWTATSYTVTWDANGGTVTTTSSSGSYGSSVTAPTPTRDGYTFSYWRNPLSGGDPIQLLAGGSYTISGNITFYAIWSANTYYISYRGNGHTGGAVPSDGSYTTGGSAYGIMGQGTLVKSGYIFTGWNTASNGTGTSYAANSSYSTSADLVLYAQWSLPTYTITWNANGGSVTPSSSSGTSGTVITAPTPTRAGYTFLYWRDYYTVTGYAYQINPGGTWTLSSNITFYAWWQQIAAPHFPPFFPPFFPPHFPPFFPPFFPPHFPPFFPPFFPPHFPPFFPPFFPPYFPPFFPPYFPGGCVGQGPTRSCTAADIASGCCAKPGNPNCAGTGATNFSC